MSSVIALSAIYFLLECFFRCSLFQHLSDALQGHDGAQELVQVVVSLDFDIIQLTFNKDGDYTVIPVVSSPIDIVNDVTPPTNISDGLEWWQVILAIVLVVLLLVLCYPILPYIIQGILWVIMIPVKLVKAISKSIKKNKESKEE